MKLAFVLFAFLAPVVTMAAQDLAKSGDAMGSFVIADNVLAGVSAPPMQERCSVQSSAPSDVCECGPNKVKVSNPCIYCSTPSGKRCGDKRCKSCYVVCSSAGSVPPQNLACN